ncbi:NfeD family protein [Cerasicoccus maritimus]|uniref:NfeD family protein n=1 Tax=Cerasicoccus maritimus TaxID=490089 RepID=UPI0028524F70|nr:NfeD family protein [Cerasicoccus maritimus]
MVLIIGLIIAGLILISFEIVVPGGILGLLGVGAVLGAVYVAFSEYGLFGAIFTFICSLVIIMAIVILEYRMLPKTEFGRKLFLFNTSGSRIRYGARTDDGPAEESLIGQQGEALTTMAPSGRIIISGKSYEGFSQSGYLNKGAQVEVVARDAFRVVVKKI